LAAWAQNRILAVPASLGYRPERKSAWPVFA
jgi:hypothetical protein